MSRQDLGSLSASTSVQLTRIYVSGACQESMPVSTELPHYQELGRVRQPLRGVQLKDRRGPLKSNPMLLHILAGLD